MGVGIRKGSWRGLGGGRWIVVNEATRHKTDSRLSRSESMTERKQGRTT